MPDHVHLFVCGSHDLEVGRWIAMLKQKLGKRIETSGSAPIWQRGFFDHVLRSDESYAQKWNYVREIRFAPDSLQNRRIGLILERS